MYSPQIMDGPEKVQISPEGQICWWNFSNVFLVSQLDPKFPSEIIGFTGFSQKELSSEIQYFPSSI